MKLKEYPAVGERMFSAALPSGMEIRVFPKLGYERKDAFLAVNFGSHDTIFTDKNGKVETPQGIAHFLEHKMFSGKNGDMLTVMQASGGDSNAMTAPDMTAYTFTCTRNFDTNLRILFDYITHPNFTEENVRSEMGIIAQEIMMEDNEPASQAYYGMLDLLYPDHVMREKIAGTEESISLITPELLYRCHSAFYVPSNMVLCVAGDVDPDEVYKIAESAYPYNMSAAPGSEPHRNGTLSGERNKISRGEVPLPLFYAGSRLDAPMNGAEYIKMQSTADVALELLLGTSSELYSSLYTAGIISSGFGGALEMYRDAAYVDFGGESRYPREAAAAVKQQAEKLSSAAINEDMFITAKKAVYGRMIRELNIFDNVCYNQACGYFRGCSAFDAFAAVEAVTRQDAAEFLVKAFCAEEPALSVVTSDI